MAAPSSTKTVEKRIYDRIDDLGFTTISSDVFMMQVFVHVVLFWMTHGGEYAPNPNNIDRYIHDTLNLYVKVAGGPKIDGLSGEPGDKYLNFSRRMSEVKKRIRETWMATAEVKASLEARR